MNNWTSSFRSLTIMLWYWQAETPSSSVNPEPRVWHVWPYVTLHGVTSTQQRGTLTHIGVCLSYLHPSTSQLWHSSSHHQRSYCHTPIDTCPFWRNSDRYESWTFVLKNVRKCLWQPKIYWTIQRKWNGRIIRYAYLTGQYNGKIP